MDHLLDLEWTVVDEVDAALASAGSPDPRPPARPPAPQTAAVTRPAQEPTRPRGPSEEDRGTSTVPARDFAPARAPAPDRTDTEVEDSNALSPCAGGAVFPGILAATVEPPRSSSVPAAGQWG
jgi:hypothetical protein